MRFLRTRTTMRAPLKDKTERHFTGSPTDDHDLSRIGMPTEPIQILADECTEGMLLSKDIFCDLAQPARGLRGKCPYLITESGEHQGNTSCPNERFTPLSSKLIREVL